MRPTTSLPLETPVWSVPSEPTLPQETTLVLIVMPHATDALELQPTVKTVPSTTNLQGQGRLAQSVLMAPIHPKETLLVLTVMLPVRLAMAPQLTALPAASTTNPQEETPVWSAL